MLQTSQIFESVKTAWGTNTPTLIAGYQKQSAVRPYGIVNVTVGETQWNTGALYDQEYNVTFEFWNSDNIESAQALGRSVYGIFKVYYKLLNLTDNANTLQIIPLPMTVIVDEERDITAGVSVEVFRVTCRFTIWIQEYRPT
jgi:hypothetical protein